jgi:drug/metabolite transporter (DMT)-like permease
VSGADLSRLVLLGALWGASFLFMRMGAGEFGPLALVFLRVAGASLLLMPLVLLRGEGPALRKHWRVIALVGLLNTAVPFVLFTTAALVLSAALMAVFNATVPIWGALVAWAWLHDRLSASRWLGLAIGLAGVVFLSWEKADFQTHGALISPAVGIAACVAAAVLYGFGANYTRKHLGGVPPMAVAAGSQVSASVVLLLPALYFWPATPPSAAAWGSALALAVGCTGLAYVLFYKLIADVGSAKAVSVTFLIPAFALLWGWLALGEQPTGSMLLGCAVILLGTALATGLVALPGRLGKAPAA